MILAKPWLRALALTSLLLALRAPAPGGAQSHRPKKQPAKEMYDKATRLYDVGRYGEAIEEYQSVYLLIDDPAMLYNIAQSYRLWDKPDEAVRFYRNYLRRSPAASNRADVEKKIVDLERTIEER